MSTQSSGVPVVEKAEVHTDSIQQHVHTQPIDLAPRASSVVQLRAVGPFSTLAHGTITAKTAVGGGPNVSGIATVGTPTSIISVNRNTPLTILPARSVGAPGTPIQGISRYQIARVGNVRSANLAGGQQPASITVTPIQASNFRLTGATVNNGSWIQAGSGAQGSYTPIRATTITVGTRAVRNDGKMIHIPQQGSVQHLTQLQMVDSKMSMLKPSLTATPIVNLRAGSIHPHPQGGTTALAPFTIRATNLNLPTIQQRPPLSITNAVAPNLQKVITQPPHGTNLHVINAQKLPHAIQTLTPMPRLCLTLSTNANLTPSNSSPVVAVASRQGGTSLIMTPSSLNASSHTGNTIPIGTKVFPVTRDGSPLVDTIFAQQTSHTASGVMVSAVTGTTTHTTVTTHSGPTSVVLAAAHPATQSGILAPHGQPHPHHHLVQVHGPISVNSTSTANAAVSIGNSLHTSSVTPGTITSGYFVEKAILQPHLQQQPRPITFEKRTDGKGMVTGSMILTTQHPNQQTTPGQSGTVTIPLTHGFAHPIQIPHTPGAQTHAMQHGPAHTQILTSLTTSQNQQIPASISMITPISTSSLSISGPTSQPLGQTSHIVPVAAQVQVHAIPTHVIAQPVVPASSPPVTTTSSSSIIPSVTISVSSPLTGPSSATQSSTVTSASVPVPVPITTASATTCPTTSSCTNTNTLSTSTPVQSPSQAKSTLSPRPSILRKREVADSHCVPLRAQRNLALNFSVNNSGTGASASVSAAAAAAAAANKENAIIGVSTLEKSTTSGISILKKEFQPPNEESSWQSCSSNSSSGSTTISTTSETAEIQMQQQQQQQQHHQTHGVNATSIVDLTSSLHHVANNSNSNSSFTSAVSSQNGMVRSTPASVPVKMPRNSSLAKTQSKDLERIKSKEKEDSVSPRKKPRKQQLTSCEFLESASPEISFYQGKRPRKNDILNSSLFEEFNDRLERGLPEEPPPTKMVYFIKKPHMSLIQSNKITSKPRQNHFHRHCDVKPKEERRPTINELANQKNVTTKVCGWKLQQMTHQVDKVIDLEVNVVTSFTSLLLRLDNKVGPNCIDRDLNRIQELLKGNIQRCKVIRDQMSESRSQVMKILDHKPLILDVINKYISKRPIKKRERL